MRIAATADTHFPFSEDRVPECDLFIHAGDLMYTGYFDEWQLRLDSLSRVKYGGMKKRECLIVPGNHDFHIQNYMGVASAELRSAGFKLGGFKHPIVRAPNGMNILCLPWVTGLPGWAFDRGEEWLVDYLSQFNDGPRIDIVVSHQPMYNALDACRPEQAAHRDQDHVGCLAYNRWFYQMVALGRQPRIWICGHIHESYGHVNLEQCDFYNVAMCDRKYEQTNEVRIIEA